MKKMLALVCAAVLLLTYVATAIAAEAVSPLANCSHANTRTTISKSQYKYINSDQHEYVPTEVHMCVDCGTVFWTHVNPVKTEDHYVWKNDKCICGMPYVTITDPPVPGKW